MRLKKPDQMILIDLPSLPPIECKRDSLINL